MNVPFLTFERRNKEVKEEVLSIFEDFFDSGWYVLGQEVKEFEDSFSAFNMVGHTIGVSNGLDALHLALKALNIGTGDEVIIPSNTFIATALAVSYVGAQPIFVEPDPETYNINPDALEAAITSKTQAIMPVHLYGQACDMGSVLSTAQKHDIYVIHPS